MPTCVASLSFFFSQFARTTRASSTLIASGFSQYTCRSRFKAQLAMKACVWSAVQMTTASRSFCSRHFRQSTYVLALGKLRRASGKRFSLTSQSATTFSSANDS